MRSFAATQRNFEHQEDRWGESFECMEAVRHNAAEVTLSIASGGLNKSEKILEYSSGGDDLGINESLRVEDVCIQTIGTPLSINSHTVVPK